LKVAFVAGVADAKNFGWAIAKQLANAGATVIVGKFEEVLASFGQDQKSSYCNFNGNRMHRLELFGVQNLTCVEL
jgi:enoyl-[acyl-carrier-protein] reductase (NADH)